MRSIIGVGSTPTPILSRITSIKQTKGELQRTALFNVSSA